MKTLRLLSFVAGIALLFSGCAGKDGAPGAQGPQGAQGNANVISLLYTVTGPASWTYDAVAFNWYVQLTPAGPLTSGFINAGGSVNVFVTYNGTSWNAVPYTEVVGANLTASWTVNFVPNLVQVNFAYSDQASHLDPSNEYAGGGQITFNVVCIAPSIMKKHSGTNWHNYAEVQSVINQENGTRVNQ